MNQRLTSKRQNKVPQNAVLLIPKPEKKNDALYFKVKPGYYDLKQMLELIDRNKEDSGAIQFIADMLETGNPKNDGFVEILRKNCLEPSAIARIVKICKTEISHVQSGV